MLEISYLLACFVVMQWLENPVGAAPARRKSGPVDVLVQMNAPGHVFLSYLNKMLAEWAPHGFVEVVVSFGNLSSHLRISTGAPIAGSQPFDCGAAQGARVQTPRGL
jgi:hypothetical protein